MSSIGFLVALPDEARSLTRQRVGFDSLAALPEGHWLAVAGAGPERAARAADRLRKQGVDALVSWGCAGALAGGIAPGDLILPELIRGAGGEEYRVDAGWLGRLRECLPDSVAHRGGVLAESVQVLPTAAEKQACHRLSGGALAVDMESAALARIALAAGLPFLAVRAIADTAAMDFPQAVTRALNPRGDVRMAALIGHLIRHPSQLPGLIGLGRHFGKAMRTLRQVRPAAGSDLCLNASAP